MLVFARFKSTNTEKVAAQRGLGAALAVDFL